MSHNDITKQKVGTKIHFSLNEHNFVPLPNVCQPILSIDSGSVTRLYQRKPGNNMKHVSVHVSVIYARSVSELINPLNVRKPVCSSKTTESNTCNVSSPGQFLKPLNVCNTSSLSQLDKPLNVSEPVCSNNATEHNICKFSSLRKLVKPSNVSRPAFFSNVAKYNVRNGNSVSQLVKLFNVGKPVCSSNASNLVICNSTYKPASKFFSDCQSVKSVVNLLM